MNSIQRTPIEEVLCGMYDLLDKVATYRALDDSCDTLWYDDEQTAHEALVDFARLYSPKLADEFVLRLEHCLSMQDELPRLC